MKSEVEAYKAKVFNFPIGVLLKQRISDMEVCMVQNVVAILATVRLVTLQQLPRVARLEHVQVRHKLLETLPVTHDVCEAFQAATKQHVRRRWVLEHAVIELRWIEFLK